MMDENTLKMSVVTKLTQGYKSVAPITHCQDMQLLQGSDGRQHFAALNEEHEVWMLSDSDQTESGNIIHRLGIVSTALALTETADGKVVLFGATTNTLYYSFKTHDGMTEPQTLPITPPEGTSRIEKILPAVFGQNYYLAIFYRLGEKELFSLSFVQMTAMEMKPFYVHTPMQTETLCGAWLGNEDNLAFQICLGQKLLRYDINELEWSMTLLKTERLIKQLESLTFSQGQAKLYALLDDEKLYQVDSHGGLTPLLMEDNTQIQSFAVFLKGDQIHFFAHSNGQLYHSQGQDEKMFSAFTVVQVNVNKFAFDRLHQDKVGVLIEQGVSVQNKENLQSGFDSGLAFFYEDAESQMLGKRVLMTESSDEFWSYNSYYSELTFTNQQNQVVKDEAFEIWTNEYCELVINDRTYHLSTTHKAVVATDILGRLRLSQSATGLDASDILFRSIKHDDEKCYVLSQNKNYQDQLRDITGTQLFEAVKGNGEPLIHEEYRDQAIMEEVAKSVRNLMRTTINESNGLSEQLLDDNLLHDIQSGEIRCFATDPGKDLFKLPAPAQAGCFEITFEQNMVCYRQLSKDEANLQTAGSSDGFISFFKDLFKTIIQGITKVVKIIINAAEDFINLTFHVVSEGLKKIENFIITTITEVSQLVGSIFATINNTFEDLMDWLGELFNWQDIKCTAEQLKKRIFPALDQFGLLLQENQSRCHKMILGIKYQLDTFLNDGIKNIDPEHSFMSQKPTDTQNKAFSNNILLDRAMLAESTMQLTGKFLLKKDHTDIIQQFIDDMVPLAEGSRQNFEQMIHSLESAISGERVLQNFLCAIVEGFKLIADAILDACVIMVDALFAIVRTLLEMLKSVLNQPLYIPFVTPFLKNVCGVELTILDAAVYLAAIPVTILCKLLTGKAPFAAKDVLGDPIVSITASLGIACACSGVAEIINIITEFLKDNTTLGICKIFSTVMVLIWIIFETDISQPGSGAAIATLVFGLLQVLLSGGIGILQVAGQVIFPPPSHLTKCEKLESILGGMLGIISIIAGSFYIAAVWEGTHCAAMRALLCMGSVATGVSGILQLGRLFRINSPKIYVACIGSAYVVDTAVATSYGVVAVIESNHQKEEDCDDIGTRELCRSWPAYE